MLHYARSLPYCTLAYRGVEGGASSLRKRPQCWRPSDFVATGSQRVTTMLVWKEHKDQGLHTAEHGKWKYRIRVLRDTHGRVADCSVEIYSSRGGLDLMASLPTLRQAMEIAQEHAGRDPVGMEG